VRNRRAAQSPSATHKPDAARQHCHGKADWTSRQTTPVALRRRSVTTTSQPARRTSAASTSMATTPASYPTTRKRWATGILRGLPMIAGIPSVASLPCSVARSIGVCIRWSPFTTRRPRTTPPSRSRAGMANWSWNMAAVLAAAVFRPPPAHPSSVAGCRRSRPVRTSCICRSGADQPEPVWFCRVR
jgi:hypothetical protein